MNLKKIISDELDVRLVFLQD